MKIATRKPPRITPGNAYRDLRAEEITGGLRSIVEAQRSIRQVQADPELLRTVRAVCQVAGVEW